MIATPQRIVEAAGAMSRLAEVGLLTAAKEHVNGHLFQRRNEFINRQCQTSGPMQMSRYSRIVASELADLISDHNDDCDPGEFLELCERAAAEALHLDRTAAAIDLLIEYADKHCPVESPRAPARSAEPMPPAANRIRKAAIRC